MTASRHRRVRRIRLAITSPLASKLLHVRALVALGVARAAILTVGFNRLEGFMGERGRANEVTLDHGQRLLVHEIRRAIIRTSSRTPWTSNCFPQALCAAHLLRRHGLEPITALGARFDDETGDLTAHAWTRIDDIAVTGGTGDAYGHLIDYSR